MGHRDMDSKFNTTLTAALILVLAGTAAAQAPAGVGGEEFGLSQRDLVQSVAKVEGAISQCMRKEGFSYIAADYTTVRRGMSADKKLPGLDEEEFIKQYGFGVSTLYTGLPPQLAKGYSPGKVGLGERNIEIFKKLSPADQVAYNRTLFGENTGATFAMGLETENFSMTGGCTRAAIEQVFKPEQLKSSYYNPKDALINKHPKMKAALRTFAAEMRKAGFTYNHPDEVEADIRTRLNALTSGGTALVEKMTPEQAAGLKALQEYELRAAAKNFKLQETLFDPVEDQILEEMYARKPK